MSDPDIDHGRADDEELTRTSLGPLKRDENGKLILSPEELANRGQTLRRLFAEWATMPDDDPPGTDETVMRNIDEERRRSGMRTLFDGYY